MRVSPWLIVALLTGGCTSYESAYERAVTGYEPVYCYQSLAGVTCHREPNHRDARRLVNYYGPAPSKYEAPELPEPAEPAPPPDGGRVVRDPDPKVTAAQPAATEGGAPTKVVVVREEGGDWRYYLPFLTVLFGAAQVAAAFLF
jgi:hypothetical protein